MDAACAIVAGAVCGLAGSVPMAVPLERVFREGRQAKASVVQGLAAVLLSFAMLSLALLVAHLAAPELTLAFGCAMMVAYLLFWAYESLRAWKDANGAGRAEGKEE